MRLLGISIASFSSGPFSRVSTRLAENNHIPVLGLGGLTFLQLTTTYSPVISGRNIGHVFFKKNQRYARSERFRLIQVFRVRNRCRWAGRRTPLVGAPKPWCTAGPEFIIGKNSPVCYTFLTSITAKVLPLVIPLTYFLLLPQPSSISNQDEEDDGTELLVASPVGYTPLPMDEYEDTTNGYRRSRIVALSASDKWQLVKPMIPKYMLPLCEWPFVRLWTGLLMLVSHQVCVYLVGERFRGFSSICSPVYSLVRIYNQSGSSFMHCLEPRA